MSIESLNLNAKRGVTKRSRFVGFMKKGSCETQYSTSGDTLHSVSGMKEFVYKYLEQTLKLAEFLKGESLEKTVANNYNYLYTHFQYQADNELQKMRSPECAFADRFSGIDCKSFSIFASSLLLNQGIKHIIRRVKQPSFNPDHWTHVYVVVPIDQKTLNLKSGYYIIDATQHINKETLYIKKHDTIMNKLPHVWLNGPAQNTTTIDDEFIDAVNSYNELLQFLLTNGVSIASINSIQTTLNSFLQNGIIPLVEPTEKGLLIEKTLIPYGVNGLNISFEQLAGFTIGGFSLSCIGGTHDRRDVARFGPLVTDAFESLYIRFNNALSTLQISTILQICNTIVMSSQQLRDQALYTSEKRWSSSCSRAATKKFLEISDFFKQTALSAFLPYLQTFFVVNLTQVTVQNNTYPFETETGGKGMTKTSFVRSVTVQQITSLQLKPETTQIPRFEFTNYILENVSSTGFNFNQFLNTLTNIATEVAGNNGNGPGNGSNNNNNTPPPPPPPPPSKAGFGIVEGVITVGVIGALALGYNSSQKNKKTA